MAEGRGGTALMHLLEQVELWLQEFGRVDRENRKFLEKLLEGDQLATQHAEVENPEARGPIITVTIFAGERGLTDPACAQNETCALGVSSQRVAVLGLVAQQIHATRLENVQGSVVVFVDHGAANAVAFAIGLALREMDVFLLARG